MKSKYTPGKWKFDKDNYNVYCNGLLAQVYGHLHNGEKQANARLIAAAPELLEAAKLLQKLMTEHADDFRIEAKDLSIDVLATSMIEKFRTAIAKAEGTDA